MTIDRMRIGSGMRWRPETSARPSAWSRKCRGCTWDRPRRRWSNPGGGAGGPPCSGRWRPFNARAKLMKAWERLVRAGEQLRESGRRLQERVGQEVESLRQRQDYVAGLYRQAYSGGRFLVHKAADKAKADLERRIRELPEAERNALNRRAQSRPWLRTPSRLPERGRDSGPSR